MDLRLIANTHENTLEEWQWYIINILNHLGMFNPGWEGEQFQVEAMP